MRLPSKSTALPTKRKTIVLVGTFRGQTTGTAKPNSRFSSLFYKNSHLFEPKSLTVPSAIKGCLLRETLRRNIILFCQQSEVKDLLLSFVIEYFEKSILCIIEELQPY